MHKPLIEYLPPILQEVAEFRQIFDSETRVILSLESAGENLMENQFIETADEGAIAHYESIMGIVPRGTDTLEDRRFRVKNRMMGDLPYTFLALKKKLEMMCGKDGFVLTVNENAFSVKVLLELTAKNQYEDVKKILAEELPANMLMDIALRYNQHKKLSAKTHAFLADYTQTQIRNEVLS